MSKIYTDLNAVLTPYATAIKKNASDITSLNGSLEDASESIESVSERLIDVESSISSSGLPPRAAELLITILRNAIYVDTAPQTDNITELEAALNEHNDVSFENYILSIDSLIRIPILVNDTLTFS